MPAPTISQLSGTINLGGGTLTLNGASTNDTTYRLTNGNSVGTLVASLGNAGSGSALSFTDASGNYKLGAITADGVALDETAANASISQTGALQTASLSLSGSGASYTLTSTGNNIGTLTGNTGSITLADAAANGLTLGTTGAKGRASARRGGPDHQHRRDHAGEQRLEPGGRGRDRAVFRRDDGHGFHGRCGREFDRHERALPRLHAEGRRCRGLDPRREPVLRTELRPVLGEPVDLDGHAGNRFVYAQSETLTVAPTGANTTTVTYDGMTQTGTSNPTGFSLTGFVGGDATNPNAFIGSAGVTGGSGRNVGTYAFTATLGTLASDFGYQFQFGSGGGLVITKAALTVSAVTDTKVYDGTTASGGAVQVMGLQGSDTARLHASLRLEKCARRKWQHAFREPALGPRERRQWRRAITPSPSSTRRARSSRRSSR